mgnify:CR=1 FL=1|jgi:hypothetical protein
MSMAFAKTPTINNQISIESQKASSKYQGPILLVHFLSFHITCQAQAGLFLLKSDYHENDLQQTPILSKDLLVTEILSVVFVCFFNF